jgi:aromatic ring hydroxylase
MIIITFERRILWYIQPKIMRKLQGSLPAHFVEVKVLAKRKGGLIVSGALHHIRQFF